MTCSSSPSSVPFGPEARSASGPLCHLQAMNRFISLLMWTASLAGLGACDEAGYARQGVPLIADETPYIVAVLEQSPDTSFHHPQVYVALATDTMDPNYSILRDYANKPNEELWHPVAWAQVGLKLSRLRIRPVPYDDAEVSITSRSCASGAATGRGV